MNPVTPRGLQTAARILVWLSVLHAAFYLLFGLDGYEAFLRPFVFAWMAVPLPIAYWLGRKTARGPAALAVVLAGLVVAFAFVVWAYWEITFGESRRTESLSGLLFIFGPLYQYAALLLALLVAWLVGRRARPAE
jgi:hypothetical protein